MTDMIRIEVDYNGNIYIRFKNKFYNILFDDTSITGMNLALISDKEVSNLVSTLEDHPQIKQYVKKGTISLSDVTLKGRVTQIMSQMDPEEFKEQLEINQFTNYDSSFKESEFFRIEKYKKNNIDSGESDTDTDDNDWDITNKEETYVIGSEIEYRFSGITNHIDKSETEESKDDISSDISECKYPMIGSSIMFSNMLNDSLAYNDTIMIKGDMNSKIVVSNIQKTDKYCTKRLIFYTDGMCKIQYTNTCTIYSKLMYNDEQLDLEFIKKIDEGLK
jgi:hypothetical protein